MKNEASAYDNAFHLDNVYGHAVQLLTKQTTDSRHKIHIDIGCGFGRIAEPLTDAIGISYVGLDEGEDGLASLRERGFETHRLILSDEEATLSLLRSALGNRSLHSISFLDTLEHLVDGNGVLRAIGRLASEHSAFVVISTPNIAHGDVGRKLALGSWAYTDSGLLDYTHVRLFDNKTFVKALRQAGLHTIDTNDVFINRSDQFFPGTHPAIAEGSLVGSYLRELRNQVDDFGAVNQFVRLNVPGPQVRESTYLRERDVDRPLLTVLIRTQGTRIHTLVEALTCLAGQSSDDFEVLVVGHRLLIENQLKVERAIEDTPDWLRGRIRLMKVGDGNRTRPLNIGFENANGQYIAILDDDDAPMAHWVETFAKLHGASPGQVLRAVAVRQNVRNVFVDSLQGLRAEGTLERVYPPTFDVLDHMYENRSPPVGLAFPRGVFHDLGLRFDQSLTTTEDWDYLMRAAGIVGVANSEQITSIYRWWTKDESSRTVHSQTEWWSNHQAILRKMDRSPFLLPKGATASIRQLIEIRNGASANSIASWQGPPESAALREKLLRHLLSSSWKLTAPLRFLGRLIGQPKIKFNFDEYDANVLRNLITRVRQSTSWKITRPLRRRRPLWWDN